MLAPAESAELSSPSVGACEELATGSGAPPGERNGRFRTGEHTKEAKAERRWISQVIQATQGDEMSKATVLAPVHSSPSEDLDAIRQRRRRVRAKVVPLDGLRLVAVPIDDPKQWRQALRKALGTSSDLFVDASLRRLIASSTLPREAIATTNSLSAALALIESMEPDNEVQAALAVNAACLHAATTNLLSRFHSGGPERSAVRLATAAARLERAFHSALETYYKLKRGNTQVIRVEKIEIQSGAQAIVGNVSRA
jgi:hypothetical protein